MVVAELATTIYNKVIVATITLFLGFLLATIASKIVTHFLREVEINRILRAAGIRIDKTLAHFVEYGIYTITILIVLQQLGLTRIVIGIITIFSVLIIGASLLLTIRDFVPNFIAGIKIKKELLKLKGKKVKIGIVEGKLSHIGVTSSIILNGEEHHVSHKYSISQKIKQIRAS